MCSSLQPVVGANDQHHIPSLTHKRQLEQQPDVGQCNGATMDQVMPLDIKPEGQWVMRAQFSWKEGFLSVHKPPILRPTLMSMLPITIQHITDRTSQTE